MRKRAEEHYKKHPTDKPHSEKYNNLMRKYNQLNHKFTMSDIKHRIKIMLQKEQIRADTKIKDMMIEMYPNEYQIALQAVFDKYGMMDGHKIRRAKIIKEWRIKPAKMPKYKK